MELHLIGIGLLALVFILGTTRGINLGAIALVCGGILVMLFAEDGADALYDAFPGDLFVLLVGVTFLFGIATVNGTIEWIVEALSRVLRGRASLMPWLLFAIAGIVTSVGALAPAVVALVAPIGMRLAKRHGINPVLAALMILHGASCGNFSPVNLLGATVNGTLTRGGLEPQPILLFLANASYNVTLGVVIYLAFGGLRLVKEERASRILFVNSRELVTVRGGSAGTLGRGDDEPVHASNSGTSATDNGADEPIRFTPIRGITLLIILVVGTVAMLGLADIGLLALTAAVGLMVAAPKSFAEAPKKIAWGVVLLITGVVAFVGVLKGMGTIDFMGNLANNLGSPLLTAFILCLIGAVVSAFASSAGIIAALIPLAMPFLVSGDISVIGLTIALTISATVVDSTPFSTIGALALSNADPEDHQRVYRGLLRWGAAMVVTAPIITMLFILPGMG